VARLHGLEEDFVHVEPDRVEFPRGQQHLEFYGAAQNDQDEDEILMRIMQESLKTA
jgi:hypothetical protein